MGGSNSRYYPGPGGGGDYGRGGAYPGHQVNPYDYPRWGYLILYLVVLLGSLLLNSLFLVTVKKNKTLHRTAHFLMACLAVRDLMVTILVIPFVIDFQVRLPEYYLKLNFLFMKDPF